MSEAAPRLNLATLLATKTFAREDLTHNRSGTLSPAQDAWRRAHPVFMDDDEPGVETLVGRVVVEGRYAAEAMGQTSFAQLVVGGRRFSLPPGLKRALVRDAPFRAYAAYGWIWSIEPASEEELREDAAPVTAYRTACRTGAIDEARVTRELQEALGAELGFDAEDAKANGEGAFSARQRRTGRRRLASALARGVASTAMVGGFATLTHRGLALMSIVAVMGVVTLFAWWLSTMGALVDALARAASRRPRRFVARVERDALHRDDVVLESGARRIRIKRAAVAVRAATFDEVSAWRFEVSVVPWTGSVLTVRALPPSR